VYWSSPGVGRTVAVVRRLLVAGLLVLAACGDDADPLLAPTTTVTVGPMGTLALVTSDGQRVTFAELIDERGLEPMPTPYGTLWFEAETGGGFMAGNCHGVTPEQVDPGGELVQVVACYGADGRDEINERMG
jgi:hypothetical protein